MAKKNQPSDVAVPTYSRVKIARDIDPVLSICSKCGKLTSCYSYPGKSLFEFICKVCKPRGNAVAPQDF